MDSKCHRCFLQLGAGAASFEPAPLEWNSQEFRRKSYDFRLGGTAQAAPTVIV